MASNLTPDTWHMAMQAALDGYKAALQAWRSDPSESNLRLLELAAGHLDYVEAQWPENDPGAT